MTAVEWLEKEIYARGAIGEETPNWLRDLYEQAKQMESEIRKEDFKIAYNQGYLDAQCNHIHDGDNLANEQEYLNSKQ